MDFSGFWTDSLCTPPSPCLSFPIPRKTAAMLSCTQGSLSLQPCEAVVPEHKSTLLALWDKSSRHFYPLPGTFIPF